MVQFLGEVLSMKKLFIVLILAMLLLFVGLQMRPESATAEPDSTVPNVRPFDDTEYVINGSPKRVLKLGVVSGRFGDPRNHTQGGYAYPHQGVDYRLPIGEQVWAAGSGNIKFAGWKAGYGWCIFIDHGNGYETRYAHLSKQWVLQGKDIQKMALIGEVGETGNARGAHLHYEIWRNGKAIDPATMVFS